MRGKAQDGRNLFAECLKCVISAAADELPRATAEADGLAIVEELVAGSTSRNTRSGRVMPASRIARNSAKCPAVTSKAAGVEVGLDARVRGERLVGPDLG